MKINDSMLKKLKFVCEASDSLVNRVCLPCEVRIQNILKILSNELNLSQDL
jgi:hypothetical protein